MNRIAFRTAVCVAVLGFASASVSPALAGDDDEVIHRGNCSGSADWKLKAKPDDGRLEVEGEVDTNRTGQRWHWKILHDGKVVKKGNATTTARSGSFSVERRVTDAAGTHKIAWRSVNKATGQTCRGALRI